MMFISNIFLLVSDKTFGSYLCQIKQALTYDFINLFGYYRAFLVKISAFYNTYSLKLETKPMDK